MRRRLLVAAVAGGIFLLLLSGVLGRGRAAVSFGLGRILAAPIDLVRNLFGRAGSEAAMLREENDRLRAEILELTSDPARLTVGPYPALSAKVFSAYPFNNHSLVTVNAGAKQGVRVFFPVVVHGRFLFGQVIEVSARQSIVRTVFDPEWKLPVKVGERGHDALFSGGRVPRLELIPKEQDVAVGDTISSAGRDIPYGLMLGTVESLRESSDRAFKEAEVRLPFSLLEVREVNILELP